jgi:hypothetical protein
MAMRVAVMPKDICRMLSSSMVGLKKNGSCTILAMADQSFRPLWGAGRGKTDTHEIGTVRDAAGGGCLVFLTMGESPEVDVESRRMGRKERMLMANASGPHSSQLVLREQY